MADRLLQLSFRKIRKIFLETSKHTELKLNDSQRILKDKIIGDVRLMILQ